MSHHKNQAKIITNMLAGFNHATLYKYAKRYPITACNVSNY